MTLSTENSAVSRAPSKKSRRLARTALLCDCALCICALLGSWALDGHPPLFAFVGFMLLCFFCNGLLFGNFSARAMEPVGHIAGVASAVIGSVSGSLALVLGTLFGRAYDGTVLPLIAGFTACGLLAFVVTELAERRAGQESYGATTEITDVARQASNAAET